MKYKHCTSGFANKKSQIRKTHRSKKIEKDLSLRKYILKGLRHYWPPKQMVGRLRKKDMIICHETIYKYIIRHQELKLGLN